MTDIAKLADLIAPRLADTITESQGVYNVAVEGALANNVADNVAAFRATAAKLIDRTETLLIGKPAAPDASLPQYRLSDGRWLVDHLGTKTSSVPGGTTDLRYRIALTQGPLILPQGHRLIGTSSHPLNDSKPVGAEVRALPGMTRRLEVVSATAVGTTVTVTVRNADLDASVSTVNVEGFSPAEYNGNARLVTAVNAAAGTFTYTASSAPSGAATVIGTITTTTRPRLLQILPSTNTAGGDSTRVQTILVNGRDVAGSIGIWTDSLQETAGVFDTVIRDVAYGVVVAAATGWTPANYTLERVSVLPSNVAGVARDGFSIFGSKVSLSKTSAVHAGLVSGDVGDSGYVLRGIDVYANNLHFEGFDYGCTIGGPGTGVGADNNFWDYLIRVVNLHGYNRTNQPGLISAARIRNTSTNVFGITLEDISINTHNKGPEWTVGLAVSLGMRRSISGSAAVQIECTNIGSGTTAGSMPPVQPVNSTYTDGNGVEWTYRHLCALVLDEVNGINIPSNSSANHRQLAYYRFGGTMGVDAASAAAEKRPVFTSYYDGLCPGGAVKGLTAATTLDREFTGGGRADILQVNYNGTSTINVDMIDAPVQGAVVYLDIQSVGYSTGKITIRHLTGATAANQIDVAASLGAASFDPAAGSRYRLTYGAGAANKWFCEPA